MKNLLIALTTLCAACSTSTPHVDLMAGVRDFDSRDKWEQTDQQEALGVQVNFAGRDGFGPELGLIVSDTKDKGGRYENRPVFYTQSKIEELYIGVRKNIMLGESFQAFVGGGVAATMLETQVDLTYADSPKDNSVAYSPYAQGGLNYLFGDNFTGGVMLRRTFWGEHEDVFNNAPPSQSNIFMFTIGYSF